MTPIFDALIQAHGLQVTVTSILNWSGQELGSWVTFE